MADNIFRLKIDPDLVVLSLGFLKLERLFLEIHKILLENIINVTTWFNIIAALNLLYEGVKFKFLGPQNVKYHSGTIN